MFVHNATAVGKTIIIVFTLDLFMRAFLGRGEFSCAIPQFDVCYRDHSRTPIIQLLLLLYPKNVAQFRVFPANPDKFLTGSLFAPLTIFLVLVLQKIFACANGLLEFYEQHFNQARFFCNHPDTQSAVFRHHSSHHLHILIIC